MTSKTKPTDPYAKAGVNIQKGNESEKKIEQYDNEVYNEVF